MTFIWPSMLVFLLVIPGLVLLYRRLLQRRRRLAAGFGASSQADGLRSAVTQRPGPSRHLPALFSLAGLVILVLSLARPETTVNLPRVEGTAILLFDVSGSMAATDVEPTRMEQTKRVAREFVLRQPPSVNIGIVSFSSNGFAVETPSNDQAALLAAIDRLKPQRGTSLGQGMMAALKTIVVDSQGGPDNGAAPAETPSPFTAPDQQLPLTGTPGQELPPGSFPSSIIVLFSDGENTEEPDPLLAAQAARERNVRVYTIGVGSPSGTTLQVDGFTVFTRLDETALQQIARFTGGAYYNAGREQDLLAIYDQITPQVTIKAEHMEVTSLFAGASLFSLLLGGLFSLVWFSRLP